MILIGGGFVLGAVIGSFLAAILLRWPRGQSVLLGRSRCDACDAPLASRYLVPILSYLALRGRCRHCAAPIDRRHLAIEIAAALIGATAFAAYPLPAAIVIAFLGWWLLLIAAIDLEHHWLPDRLTYPLAAAGLAVAPAGFGPPLADRLIGLAAGAASLLAVGAIYRLLRRREGLGGGDPKLLAAIGAWLGWQQLPLVLAGAGLVGLAAILLLWMRGETVRADSRLPLGTLMAVAAWPIWVVVGMQQS